MSVHRGQLSSIAVIVLLIGGLVMLSFPAQATFFGGQAVGTSVPQQTDDTGVILELRPQNASIGIDGSITYAVVVSNVSGGVGAYNMSLSLEDAAPAAITAVNLRGSPGLTDVTFGPNNDTVRFVASLADTADSGQVTIANVTLRGIANGVTTVDLSVVTVADESGTAYTVRSIRNAQLSVGNPLTETTASTTSQPTTAPTATSTSETTPQTTSTNAAPTTSGDSGPGFTAAIAVIAILVATFVGRIRSS